MNAENEQPNQNAIPESSVARGSVHCVKCTGTDISTRWHKNDWACRYADKTFDGEHLHRICRNCGYEWADQTADAPNAPAHRPEREQGKA